MRVLIDGSREGFSGVLVRTDTVESVTLIADRWTDEECNGYGDSYSDRVSVGFEVLDCSGVASKVRVVLSHRAARVLSGLLLRHLHGFGGAAIGGSWVSNVLNGS